MLTIEIKTGNAAFCDVHTGKPNDIAERNECIRILQKIIEMIDEGYNNSVLMDANGNRVGSFVFHKVK